MENISEKLFSYEEAKAALKYMRHLNISEDEAIETFGDVVERIRNFTAADSVRYILENNMTSVQREFMKKYWYEGMNATQIARMSGTSQAYASKTIDRGNEIIKEMMTPLILYQQNLKEVDIRPVVINELEICKAQSSLSKSLGEALYKERKASAISPETMARALKISQRKLSDIESGRLIPSITTALRYSELLKMKIKMTFENGRGFYEWERA